MFKTKDNVELVLQVVACALGIVLLVLSLAGGAVWYFLGRITYDDPYASSDSTGFDSNIVVGQGFSETLAELGLIQDNDNVISKFSAEEEINAKPVDTHSLAQLQESIKNWFNNGAPVHDSAVINILLIGMDNETLSQNSRADAMIIVSINQSTKAITLCSVLRDQYCYIVSGNKGSFTKLHHAMVYGGPDLQIAMIEKYYKIRIDNYAIMNFDSLPKLINALGGVTVEVTDKEFKYMNTKAMGDSKKALVRNSDGTVTMNGLQALTYMRIRKLDSDNNRAGRQQKVMQYLINTVKGDDKTKLLKAVDTVIPYIRTGYTPDEIVSLATKAFTDGWLHYPLSHAIFPEESQCDTATINDGWYWTVDFPAAAQAMQLRLYGQTNITLSK